MVPWRLRSHGDMVCDIRIHTSYGVRARASVALNSQGLAATVRAVKVGFERNNLLFILSRARPSFVALVLRFYAVVCDAKHPPDTQH